MQTQDTLQVDTVLRRMHGFLQGSIGRPKASMRLSESDVRWLLAEIEGGREACAALAGENRLLKRRLAEPVQA